MRQRPTAPLSRLFILATAGLFGLSCASSASEAGDVHAELACAPVPCEAAEPTEAPELKNIVLLIGDGMGPQQIGLLELYARYADDPRYPDGLSHIGRMLRDGTSGVVIPTPADGLVNDSAAAATQFGSGEHAHFGVIGLSASGERTGSVLTRARDRGMRTGLVSDTRITHATPAAFAAYVTDRWQENTIAEQLLAAKPDLLFSGGWRYFLPQGIQVQEVQAGGIAERFEMPPEAVTSLRQDDRNLLIEAQDAGYSIVTHPAALADLESLPALGLFAASGMQSGTEWWAEQDSQSPSQPALHTMAIRALELLSADDVGLFVMIEGGQIDWAGHNNESQRLLHEMIRFDLAVGAVLDWADARDDTIVVLTADHETGGFSIHYDAQGPPTAELFHQLDSSPQYVSWATGGHTHTPVLATSYGDKAYALRFGGIYHQTQLGQMLVELVDLVPRSAAHNREAAITP